MAHRTVAAAVREQAGVAWTRAKKLCIETLAEACPQGRASMLNFHAVWGKEKKAIGYDDTMLTP